MNKRQLEVEKAILDNEKEVLNDLKKTYTKALSDVKQRIKLLQADEATHSKIRQLDYQKALESQINGILGVLNTDNIVAINNYLNKTYENGYLGVMYNMQSEGIPLIFGIDEKEVLQSISKKIENMTFADRLDTNMKDFKTKIKAEITRGIANNSTYSEIARQLSLKTKEGLNSTYRIARTEGGRVATEAKYNSMIKAKNNGADIVKQWDSTLDGKTRDSHARLDGQIKELDEPFEIDGMKAMYPHGFGDGSMDINCRCVVLERARWAVEGEKSGADTFTKAVRNDDGTVEVKEFNAKTYESFKQEYFKWKENKEEFLQLSLEDFKKYFEENKKFINEEDAKMAYFHYVCSAQSRDINKLLREHGNETLAYLEKNPDSKFTAETIKALDNLTTSYKLDKGIKTYRFVTDEYLENVFGEKYESNNINEIIERINNKYENAIIQDDAFISTSAIREKNIFNMFGFSEVEMRIDVKKGSTGFFTKNIDETEFILPRNSKLKFINANTDDSKRIILNFEVEK